MTGVGINSTERDSLNPVIARWKRTIYHYAYYVNRHSTKNCVPSDRNFFGSLLACEPEEKRPQFTQLRNAKSRGKCCCPLRRGANNALDLLASRIVRRFPQELTKLIRCFLAAIKALQYVRANQMHIGKIIA